MAPDLGIHPADVRIAYFSMEIALEPAIPTYSGGLGVVAGDFLHSAADRGVPMVAVTLVHHLGHLCQTLDAAGRQTESPAPWDPSDSCTLMPAAVQIDVEGRSVEVRAWRAVVTGQSGHRLPIYLLDTDWPANEESDRRLTDTLYGGDAAYRLSQEIVLGIGGVELLEALGHSGITTYHMNEGHAALLALALLERDIGSASLGTARPEQLAAVRARCVFTTHTPVPAGHDQFSRELVRRMLGAARAGVLDVTHCCPDAVLNMTYLAVHCSRYVNGVAMRHGEVSRQMLPTRSVAAITNGVHAARWASPPFVALFDQHLPEWRRDNLSLRYIIGVPSEEIRAAHRLAKQSLLSAVEHRRGVTLAAHALTIGFARRATAYKRPLLVFRDCDRLRRLAREHGPVQFVFGGKAHPRDAEGKAIIEAIHAAAASLGAAVPVVYLEDYDMRWAQLLTAGVDLWLNTPRRPLEASGTSGMKAALNGVPSLSVLDGWWVEGCLEGVTGWSIGDAAVRDEHGDGDYADALDAESLYTKLDLLVLPTFYGRPEAYGAIMRSSIALNGAFFNSQRMLEQYVVNAYAAALPDPAYEAAEALRGAVPDGAGRG